MAGQQQSKKGKRQRKPRCGDRDIAQALSKSLKKMRLARYIRELEKKYKKLLDRRERGLKRTPAIQVLRNKDGSVKKNEKGKELTKEVTRFQGMMKESERAGKLKAHIQTLKQVLKNK